MSLADILTEDLVKVPLEGRTKSEVIEELVDVIVSVDRSLDKGRLLDAVLERERLMSTGLEKGVAVPHAKTRAVSRMVASLGISKEGVDFEAADSKPSYVFFMIIAPENASGPHIRLLAEISKLAQNERILRRLRDANSPGEVLRVIRGE